MREVAYPMDFDRNNISQFIDRSAYQAPALQYLRELLINEKEAGATRIEIRKVSVDGVSKLAFCGNGHGMSEKELLLYMNTLNRSGKKVELRGHFGMGARITALPYNQHGILIYSKRDREAWVSIKIGKDSSGTYGALRMQGEEPVTIVERPTCAPRWIENQGTVIVLLGNSSGEDTTIPPQNAPTEYKTATHRWVQKYLNNKFFRNWGSVGVSCFDEKGVDSTGRLIHGMKHYLDKWKLHSGTVTTDEADIHWWLMDETNDSKGYSHGVCREPGYCGLVFENELYHTQGADGLRLFGILFGHKRIVINVEPNKTLDVGNGDLARSTISLLRGGTQLTVDEFMEDCGKKFNDNMPAEIRKFLDEQSARFYSEEHDETELLKTLGDIVLQTGSTGTTGGGGGGGNGGGGGSGGGGGDGAKHGPLPKAYWVAQEEFTECPHYAAFYDSTTHSVVFNKGYVVFQEVLNKFLLKHPEHSEWWAREIKRQLEIKIKSQVWLTLSRKKYLNTSRQTIAKDYLSPQALTSNAVDYHLIKTLEFSFRSQARVGLVN